MQYQERLDEAEARFNELTAQMADPAVINDSEQYRKVAKAQSELTELVAKYREWKKAHRELIDARAMLERNRSGFAGDGGSWKCAAGAGAASRSNTNSRFCCCPKIRTTRKTLCSRFARARAATRHRCLPAKFSACTRATRKNRAGKWRSLR